MVGAFLGAKAAGIYTAASKTSTLVAMIIVSVKCDRRADVLVALGSAGRAEPSGWPRARVTVWVFWPSLLVSIVLAVGAKPILGLFGAGSARQLGS